MDRERKVLDWLRDLRERPPAGEPVLDEGPVWAGARLPPPPGPVAALFSPDALRRAWLVVRANGGGPGIDGVTRERFEAHLEEELAGLAAALAAERYRPHFVLRVWVPKRQGGERPITIWTVGDRVVQRALYETLLPLCEPHFLPCSFGYRPGRGVPEAVAAVGAARDAGHRWVLHADIRHCFDTIRSDRLLRALGRWVADRRLLRLTKRFLDARVVDPVRRRIESAGITQGSVLSPLLCNVYLHAFDEAMMPPGPAPEGATLVRFADDFVVLAARKRGALAARSRASRVLVRLGLALNPDKTRIVHFDEGFEFLGVSFRGREARKR